MSTKKKRIEIHGDTTTFFPDAFKLGHEKKLEDLLKNLPGMEVNKETGSLKFKGKSVQQIQINGDDLLGNNYALLSKNLSLDLVKSIDAIENFNENPLLKDMGNSDKIALNVKLVENSKSLVTEIASSVGYGNKGRQNQSIQLLGIIPKIKFFSSINSNNIGINQTGLDLSKEEKMENFERKGSYNNLNYIDHFFQKPLPEISQSTENSEKSLGLGSFFSPYKSSQIRWQMNLSADQFYSKETVEMSSELDTSGINYKDLTEGYLKPFLAYSNLQFIQQINANARIELNYSTQYLKSSSSTEFKRNLEASEKNQYENNLLGNSAQLEFTQKLNRGSFQFFVSYMNDQKRQSISLALPNLSEATLIKPLVSDQQLQFINHKSETQWKYNLPFDQLKLSISLEQQNEQYKFQSSVDQDKVQVINYSNYFVLNAMKWMQKNQIKYEKNKLKISFQFGINWSNFLLSEKYSMTKNIFFVPKELMFSYKLFPKSSVVLAYTDKSDIPNDLPYFGTTLFTDNRNSKKYLVDLDFIISRNLFFLYRKDHLLEGITQTFQANMNFVKNGMLNKIHFGDSFFETVGFQKNIITSQYSFLYQINKYFIDPNVQIQLNANYQIGNSYAEMSAQGLQEVSTKSKGISGKLTSKLGKNASFIYEFNMDWFSSNSIINTGENHASKHGFILNYQLKELLHTTISMESIKPGSNSDKWFHFVNFKSIFLKELYKRYQIGFEIKNLFNYNQIQTIENSMYGRSIREVQLLPRIWQVNVLFKI